MRNILLMMTIGISICSCSGEKKEIYKDPNAPIPARIDDLLSRMTIEEKVGQMNQFVGVEHIKANSATMSEDDLKNNTANAFYPGFTEKDIERYTEEGKVGSFLHVMTLQEANYLQGLAMKSRLQIPIIFGIDAIHGNAYAPKNTIYPTSINLACSFDTAMAYTIARQTAREMRAMNMQWTFNPNVEVARDPRWGRVGETFGEDPYLVTRMGVATIKGYQGSDFTGDDKVLACGKHIIAGSEPSNGTNAAPMDVSERTLREVFLPPYKAAIQEANVFTLMAAHNELNGVPCHADKWMLTDVMRNEYGFDGFVVSDWMDVERIHELHKVAPTMKDAYYETVNAGLDMHMHGPGFMEGVIELVNEGRLTEEQINRACKSILEAKFKLGLFENPYVDIKQSNKMICNEDHQNSALELAEKSIVLLKNDGLLPLDFSKYKNILVTGPNANSHAILGDWTLQQPEQNVVTILDGIRAAAGSDKVMFYDYGEDVRQIVPKKVDEAAELAAQSDLAIVVVGENPLRYQRTKTTGENVDRMSLDLLGSQDDLVKAIHGTGIPTIVVLVGGRPLSVNWIADNVPALIQAWEPGSFGGTAVASIITGEVNPSAKLPVSIPRHAGQIQMIYNHKPSQYFHKYKDGLSTPLYPFGYGLSYTDFKFGQVQLSKDCINPDDSLNATIELTNTGKSIGTEVVQLYIRDEYSSATRPVKELKDFKRVTLNPGESTEVNFTITPDKLAYFDRSMNYSVEPGTFVVMIGSSSLDKDLSKSTFSVSNSK